MLWGIRVVIPDQWRGRLLAELHRDHPGACKMKSVARSYTWWPGMDSEIENVAKSCSDCHAVKKAPPTAPLHPWEWPSRVFQRVHVDFAGPFQGAMFLVAVDAYSKWPHVVMMQTTTVSKMIDVLRQMFSMYGVYLSTSCLIMVLNSRLKNSQCSVNKMEFVIPGAPPIILLLMVWQKDLSNHSNRDSELVSPPDCPWHVDWTTF